MTNIQRSIYTIAPTVPSSRLQVAKVTDINVEGEKPMTGHAYLGNGSSCKFHQHFRRLLVFDGDGFDLVLQVPEFRSDFTSLAILKYPFPNVGDIILLSVEENPYGRLQANNWATLDQVDLELVKLCLKPRTFRLMVGRCDKGNTKRPVGKQAVLYEGPISSLTEKFRNPPYNGAWTDLLSPDYSDRSPQPIRHYWQALEPGTENSWRLYPKDPRYSAEYSIPHKM